MYVQHHGTKIRCLIFSSSEDAIKLSTMHPPKWDDTSEAGAENPKPLGPDRMVCYVLLRSATLGLCLKLRRMITAVTGSL